MIHIGPERKGRLHTAMFMRDGQVDRLLLLEFVYPMTAGDSSSIGMSASPARTNVDR